MLPEAPEEPTTDETPAFGTYAGRCVNTDLRLSERGVGRLRRAISEKRWQWFGAFDESLAVGGAIVDAGVFGSAFLWVFDREAESLVVDTDVLVPSSFVSVATEPASGVVATIDLPRRRLRISRTGNAVSIDGRFGGAELALVADASGLTAMTAVCPVAERKGGLNVTQKETCLPVEGYVRADSDHDFDGIGMLDYSHGLLGRETAWKWAIGSCTDTDGRPVGFNVVSGFNDELENTVWVDGRPEAVEDASFSMGEDEWNVETPCGTVDVTLSVAGSRDEDIDVGLLASEYRQPLGRWTGSVAGHDITGVGVAEQHRAKW